MIRPHTTPALCVLASGSAGNCSVLLCADGAGRKRALLIDAGLSPRRTWNLLEERGVDPRCVEAIVLTHLDHDHFHDGWRENGRAGLTLFLHASHLGRAGREGALFARAEPFADRFEPLPGVPMRTRVALAAHDELGVAVFRFEFESDRALGFATDLGRVPPPVEDLLRGVDVLAIESNYCPRLQEASDRPEFLKRRIMAGRGHLSNQQCAQAVARVEPREHVVLLHLSRQCNRPDLAAEAHAGADYALTIATQDEPTRWVRVGAPGSAGVGVPQPAPAAAVRGASAGCVPAGGATVVSA